MSQFVRLTAGTLLVLISLLSFCSASFANSEESIAKILDGYLGFDDSTEDHVALYYQLLTFDSHELLPLVSTRLSDFLKDRGACESVPSTEIDYCLEMVKPYIDKAARLKREISRRAPSSSISAAALELAKSDDSISRKHGLSELKQKTTINKEILDKALQDETEEFENRMTAFEILHKYHEKKVLHTAIELSENWTTEQKVQLVLVARQNISRTSPHELDYLVRFLGITLEKIVGEEERQSENARRVANVLIMLDINDVEIVNFRKLRALELRCEASERLSGSSRWADACDEFASLRKKTQHGDSYVDSVYDWWLENRNIYLANSSTTPELPKSYASVFKPTSATPLVEKMTNADLDQGIRLHAKYELQNAKSSEAIAALLPVLIDHPNTTLMDTCQKDPNGPLCLALSSWQNHINVKFDAAESEEIAEFLTSALKVDCGKNLSDLIAHPVSRVWNDRMSENLALAYKEKQIPSNNIQYVKNLIRAKVYGCKPCNAIDRCLK